MQIDQMPMVRVFFEKTGRVKYISHLDTMRTLTRALRRSGLPLWYTQGFNPHLYMTFALPIALGYESRCESLDLRFTKEVAFDAIVRRLNRVLPPGFRVLSAAAPVQAPAAIAWAEYEVALTYLAADTAALHRRLDTLLAQPVIEVAKKTKKGEIMLDIRPHIHLLKVREEPQRLVLRLRLAAGQTLNIAPVLLLQAFYAWSSALPDGVRIVRTAILDDALRNFA